MPLLGKLNEDLALGLLAREGIAAIWMLNMAAAAAHRAGYSLSAQSILELADAAEDAWPRAEGKRSPA